MSQAIAGKRAGPPGLWQVREQGVPGYGRLESRTFRAMAGRRAGHPELRQVREQGVPSYGRQAGRTGLWQVRELVVPNYGRKESSLSRAMAGKRAGPFGLW